MVSETELLFLKKYWDAWIQISNLIIISLSMLVVTTQNGFLS